MIAQCSGLFISGNCAGATNMTEKEKFYQSNKWETRRDLILRRDGYMCQLCKKYGRRIEAKHVHHIFPYEHYPEHAVANWNLISLCQSCHNKMHDRDTHELTQEGMKLLKSTARKWEIDV